MNLQLYIFSNTYNLDFHEINVPQDNSLLVNCRKLLDELGNQIGLNEMTLFCKEIEGKIYVGTMISLKELNNLSSRYFHVARNNGETLTQTTFIFVLEKGEKLFITKDLLYYLVKSIFTKKVWNGTKVSEPSKIILDIPCAELDIKRQWLLKSKFTDIYEAICEFNARLCESFKKNKGFDILYSYSPSERVTNLSNIYKNKISLKGENNNEI